MRQKLAKILALLTGALIVLLAAFFAWVQSQ
jgi:hypothetical protein